MSERKYYDPEQIRALHELRAVQSYFWLLCQKGVVKFLFRSGEHLYFKSPTGKYAVNEKYFYEFKEGKGGALIRAVMLLENKSWYEAVGYLLQEFSGLNLGAIPTKSVSAQEKSTGERSRKGVEILLERAPQNGALLSYFLRRGISYHTVLRYCREVHVRLNGKIYITLGLKNSKEGWDLRSRRLKIKSGENSFAVVGDLVATTVVVVEGLCDLLSYVQFFGMRGLAKSWQVVSLNSVGNLSRFISQYGEFTGKVLLLLDADAAGDKATSRLLDHFGCRASDIRSTLGLSAEGPRDVNELLKRRAPFLV